MFDVIVGRFYGDSVVLVLKVADAVAGAARKRREDDTAGSTSAVSLMSARVVGDWFRRNPVRSIMDGQRERRRRGRMLDMLVLGGVR